MDKSYKELLGNRPKGFTKESIESLKKTNYSISHKIDGQHRFVRIRNRSIELIDVNNNTSDFGSYDTDEEIICEAEFLPRKNILYVFDLIYINKDISHEKFSTRYKMLCKIKFPSTIMVKKFYFPKSKSRISYYCKTLLKEKPSYDVDGIIFMPTDLSYYEPNNIYKWKPPNKNTADFLVINHRVYCGINRKQFLDLKLHHHPDFKNVRVPNYFKIEFKAEYFGLSGTTNIFGSSEKEYNDSIVECLYGDGVWIPQMIRNDKTESYLKSKTFTGPNNYNTIVSIYKESLDPITEEQLTHLVLE